MEAHRIYEWVDEYDDRGEWVSVQRQLAMVHPAKPEFVKKVLEAPTEGSDGRSEWMWIRLPDGTLILGVFPKGDTYMEVSDLDPYPKGK